MPDDTLVLALDIGTSSARAMLFDPRGKAVEGLRSQVHYSPETDASGAAVLDADRVVEAVAGCVDGVLRDAGDRARHIRAVGAATFWHSMLGVDASGAAVTPLYTWADTRSAEAASRLRSEVDAAAVHARTGCAIHPSYYPARILWLRESAPDEFGRAAKWISPGEYLYSRLFGGSQCSLSMASGTGLFDQHGCRWDADMIQAVGLRPDALQALTDIDAPATGLSHQWAERWPVLASIPWIPAIGDGAASNLGSGCATSRRIAINLGTSGAIRVLWQAGEFTIPPDLWCYRLDRRRPVMGAAFSDGGDSYAWAAHTLALPATDAVEQEMARRTPGAHGLVFLPFLAGERSIGWRPDARATLHGMSVSTAPLDIVEAIMEGVALRFALAARTLFREFPDAREIVASGGAIGKSPAWARMISDAIGHPITLWPESEATARGAAAVALAAIGQSLPEEETAGPIAHIIEPNPAHHELFQEELARQEDLYRRLL